MTELFPLPLMFMAVSGACLLLCVWTAFVLHVREINGWYTDNRIPWLMRAAFGFWFGIAGSFAWMLWETGAL